MVGSIFRAVLRDVQGVLFPQRKVRPWAATPVVVLCEQAWASGS